VFPSKTIDVTNTCAQICGCTTTTLQLDPEEMTVHVNNCCTNFSRKKEYSQIDNVNMVRSCVCCKMAQAEELTFSPGCGCNGEKVSEVVEELRERIFARGAIGQIKKQERMLKQVIEITNEMALVEQELGIQYPPDAQTEAAVFGPKHKGCAPPVNQLEENAVQVQEKEYNVTDTCASCMGCLCTCGMAGCTDTKMELKEDYMLLTEKNNCGVMEIKQPYGNLGSVDFDKFCCCCYSVNQIAPGWGCSKDLVSEISGELQHRKVARGNIAQLKQLEKMMSATTVMGLKADLMMHKSGVQYPPNQEVMSRVYGPYPPRALTNPLNPPHLEANKDFEVKEYDVTNNCSRCCTCLCSCGMAGPCATRTLRLEKDEMYITDVNWCCKSNERTPYAQIDAVETEEVCCAICTEVPDVANPGCGCSNAMVTDIANELQERKNLRGMIAQLKTQENMLNEVLQLGVKADLLLDHFASLKRK